MRTYPLESLSVEQATALQFKIVDAVTRHFDGGEVLSLGDLGVKLNQNKPDATIRVERVFADVFGAERALLVRGAGTGALRWSFLSVTEPNCTVLIHDAPVYPTTKITLDSMAEKYVSCDFNDMGSLERLLQDKGVELSAALVQHTRQKPDDSYDFEKVIRLIKRLRPRLPIVTDDNYAALKTNGIGCEYGADVASFSCFKVLGPEGVGVLLGKDEYVKRAYEMQYSGGSQVQGHEAMAALRGLIYAPVALAIEAVVIEELCGRINAGELEGARAFIANSQSKVLLIEFEDEIAQQVIKLATKYGAAPHPVGSESRYEFAPMVYRISGTFREQDKTLEKRMIRVNPMRAGADTVLRILRCAVSDAKNA